MFIRYFDCVASEKSPFRRLNPLNDEKGKQYDELLFLNDGQCFLNRSHMWYCGKCPLLTDDYLIL